MPALVVGCALTVVGCAARDQVKTPITAPPHSPVRYYQAEIIPVPNWGEPDRGPMDPTIAPYDPLTAAGSGDQIKALFRGTDRKMAKTSFAELQTERESTIDQLVVTLIADRAMLAHEPPITGGPSSERVQEEYRSVKIRGWIYAIKNEDDQDWHLIVGTDPAGGATTYLSCEISGLPMTSATAYATLLEARKSLASILDNDLPGPGSYTKYTPPIPVAIEGMLFFDVNRPAGAVGPTGMRPNTAWEVHPITKIELGPT
jgi:hypothetical protein